MRKMFSIEQTTMLRLVKGLFILLLLNQFSAKSQGLVNIVAVNKDEFVVTNNLGYPLTFKYQGRDYFLNVDVSERPTLLSELTGNKDYKQVITRSDVLDLQFDKSKKIRDQKYSVILDWNRQWDKVLFLIMSELKMDKESVKVLFESKDDDTFLKKLTKEYFKQKLSQAAVDKFLQLYEIYTTKSYTERNLYKDMDKRQYRAYNPFAMIEWGGITTQKISPNWSKNETYMGKFLISPFPEIKWSRDKFICSRIYLTASYHPNKYTIETDSSVYVGKSLVSTSTSDDFYQLTETKTKDLMLENKEWGFGLNINTQIHPIFSFFVEGGIKKQMNDYSLKVKNRNLFKSGQASFTQSEYKDIVLRGKEIFPYATVGANIMLIANPIRPSSTRRGFYLSGAATIFNNGGLKASNAFNFVTETKHPLVLTDKSKTQIVFELFFGVSF